MITCVIPCSVPSDQFKAIEQSLEDFSETVGCYGFQANFSYSVEGEACGASITLLVDDEKIEAMKGAKRGPKVKATNISVEEMLELKHSGCPPKEIAKRAGIGVATYFRRMAAYKAQSVQEQEAGGGMK